MAKIVVTDTDFGDSEFERKMVEAAGIRFAAFNDADARSPREIIEHLQGADGAITSYGSFTAEVFEALPHLRVVSKTGTGVDNIDVAAATKNRTLVCNVPGYGTEVVSAPSAGRWRARPVAWGLMWWFGTEKGCRGA